MRINRRQMIWGATATIAAVGFARAASAAGQPLRLAYASTTPGPDSTFLFAGAQLGYFKEQGIDLQIQNAGGAVGAAALVASGTADLALGSVDALPGYVLKGVAMKAVYMYSYRPIFRLAFFVGSDVQEVSALKGKKVGLLSLASSSALVLQAILVNAGLTMDDVTLVPLGVGPAAVAAVQAKQVDALIYHDTFYPFLEKNDIHVTFYQSPMLDRPFAGQGIFGMEDYIQGKKDLVTAFLRGLTKSLTYSTTNPAAATKAFADMHPEIGKQLDLEEAAWRERIKITFPIDGRWGVMDDEMWNNLDDLLLQGKVITEKPDIKKLYTTDFVASANEKAK